MATIGTFTANSKGEFTGVIKTLTLNIKVIFRPVEKDGEKSPDFRVSTADMDIGAGWKKNQSQRPRLHLGQAGRSELPGSRLCHAVRNRNRRPIRPHLVALTGRRAPPFGGAPSFLDQTAHSHLPMTRRQAS